jgi:hypothetical protein
MDACFGEMAIPKLNLCHLSQLPLPPSRRSWQPQKAWYSHVRIAYPHVLLTLLTWSSLPQPWVVYVQTTLRHERAGSCQSPDDLTNDPSGVNQSIKRALALTPPLLLSYGLGAAVSPGQIDEEPFLCSAHRGLAPKNGSEGTQQAV